MMFTVIGAGGFIGSALVARLLADGHEVQQPARGASELFTGPLGHVIYAAGVTADFRERPFDSLRANTSLLADVLERAEFDSLLYLSSARVYRHATHTREDAAIALQPHDPEDLYDLTKLTAESLCQASRRQPVRVVRLSNVVGADFGSKNFLTELIRGACDGGHIALRSAPHSEKDYVLLADVVDILPRIALSGRQRCYNLGAGRNLTHAQVVQAIVACTGARLSTLPGASAVVFPALDTTRLSNEFGFSPRAVLAALPLLIADYQKHHRTSA
jgi:nucleoside-diphosphate-sugar epimerase